MAHASTNSPGLLVVERFELGEALHFKYGMPVLRPSSDGEGNIFVISSSVSLSFSFFHAL